MSATRWRRAWKLAITVLNCLRWFMCDTLHHLGIVSAKMQDTAGVFA